MIFGFSTIMLVIIYMCVRGVWSDYIKPWLKANGFYEEDDNS